MNRRLCFELQQCFRVHHVSNMGSHSIHYSLIVSFTYVRWPEDELRKTETCYDSKIPISYCCVLDGKNSLFFIV